VISDDDWDAHLETFCVESPLGNFPSQQLSTLGIAPLMSDTAFKNYNSSNAEIYTCITDDTSTSRLILNLKMMMLTVICADAVEQLWAPVDVCDWQSEVNLTT